MTHLDDYSEGHKTTYVGKLHDNPVAPSHDANVEIEANLERSNRRFNAFLGNGPYTNGAHGWQWAHADRMEMLAEAQWCEMRAQTLLLAEQTKLLSQAFGLGYDVGMILDRIKDDTGGIYTNTRKAR